MLGKTAANRFETTQPPDTLFAELVAQIDKVVGKEPGIDLQDHPREFLSMRRSVFLLDLTSA